jgi:hypothetical protein
VHTNHLRVAEQGYLAPLDHGAGSFCRCLNATAFDVSTKASPHSPVVVERYDGARKRHPRPYHEQRSHSAVCESRGLVAIEHIFAPVTHAAAARVCTCQPVSNGRQGPFHLPCESTGSTYLLTARFLRQLDSLTHSHSVCEKAWHAREMAAARHGPVDRQPQQVGEVVHRQQARAPPPHELPNVEQRPSRPLLRASLLQRRKSCES